MFNKLPNNLKGRNIHSKVIPTVCNLQNMLNNLAKVQGDLSRLKQWEKRCYKAYRIEEVKNKIIYSPKNEWKQIIRIHILNGQPLKFGANCIDIYLVTYVSEMYGKGRNKFFEFVKANNISEKRNLHSQYGRLVKVMEYI